MALDLTKLDLYGIMGVETSATQKEIVKGYRKKALKCHPDKNPDNPKAAQLFDQLTKALEVLTDTAARAAYDKILNAKKAAQIRHKELDGKRKKFKEDLEARENAAQERKVDEVRVTKNLEAEIQRLRKEGSTLVEEEKARLEEELKRDAALKKSTDQENEVDSRTPRLKVKWNSKKDVDGSYTEDFLHRIFHKYGDITALLVSGKKKGSAIVEFSSPHAAVLAVQNEIGLPENPLTLTWISGEPATMPQTKPTTLFAADSSMPTASSEPERDFESLVLMRMRQAEERKRLIADMTDTEEKG